MASIMGTTRTLLLYAAFSLAVFPSFMKMYETSHWFREGDPSQYDNAKEWFSNPKLPFESYFNSSKVLMRIYFFIIPYILSALCVTIALAIPAPVSKGYHLLQPRRAFGSFLRRSVSFPKVLVRVGFPARVSIAELIGVAIFLTLNFLTIAVRVRRSLPRGSRKNEFLVDSDKTASKEPIDSISWQACEVWAKTLGVISILNLGWYLLMPVGRKSVLLEALGVSWERAIKYHRWVGYYSVAIMWVHSVMYVAIFIHGNGHESYDPDGSMLQMNMVPWYCHQNECDDDQARMLRINMYGLVTMFLIAVMTVFTLPWFRRQKFEWFFYAHHLFLLVLVFVGLHYKGSIIYLVPGIAIYGVDKLMAMYSYRKAAPVATRMLSSDVIEISFETKPGVTYKAGDYVFLNVPAVSFLQWHPFSLTSAPSVNGGRVMFHLKGVPGAWTEQVVMEAYIRGDEGLRVRMDGFYGVNDGIVDHLQGKDGVIFVGGGIGVTPMMSLAMEMCETCGIPVSLMWVVRSIDEFGIFSTELTHARRKHEQFKTKSWITLSNQQPVPTDDGREFDKAMLSEFENCELVLRSIKKSQPPNGITTAAPFIMDQPSLSGASNAAVMTLSLVFALVAYALAVRMSDEDTYADTVQDYITLMELTMATAFVMIWILVVILVRRGLSGVHASALEEFKPSTRDDMAGGTMRGTYHDGTHRTKDGTHRTNDGTHRSNSASDSGPLVEVIQSDTASSVSSGSGLSGEISRGGKRPKSRPDLEDAQSDKHVLRSIIEGNIGCRPNIPEEFDSFAKVLTEQMGRSVDIAVLACGPPKLVESINNYINVPSSSRSHEAEKDKQAFFSFIEEDWEW